MSLRESIKQANMNTPLVKRIVRNYIRTLLLFLILMVVGVYLAYSFFSNYIWYPTDLFWPLLHWLHDNVLLVGTSFCLFVWLMITIGFWITTLRHLHELVNASKQLTMQPDEPVRLPNAMKEIQDELNGVREQAQRNAYLAKEAEQRKNDLIVYLAHDLKTPLTSVIGYLTLLCDEPDISAQMRAKYTGIALDKAQRLETLINEFFDITRFNLTAMQLEKMDIDLSMMLEQLSSEFAPVLAERNLKLESRIAPGIRFVCDPDKLERVFDNLLRNAMNYSYSDTGISLTMGVENGWICIRCKNRGRTISQEKLAHIFEQFYRLDSSRSTATGGAGLGLAIAKEIVELHRGKIAAESADETVTFTVLLPMGAEEFINS